MDINFFYLVLYGITAVIVAYILFRSLPRLADNLFNKVPGFNRIEKTLAYFLSDLFGIALVAFGAVYFLTLLPRSAAIVAVITTVASGAFIFTSEGWLGDAMAGVSLQLYPQYKIDDWVTLGGDKRGRVARLGLFRTQLETIQLDIISIRNSNILNEDIFNHSAMFLRRLQIVVHTADYGEFGDDIYAYKAALLNIAIKVQEEICPEAMELDRHPKIFFMEFGSSSDHLHIIFFTYDRDEVYGMSIDAMHTALAAALRPRGVVLGQVNANVISDVVTFQPVTNHHS